MGRGGARGELGNKCALLIGSWLEHAFGWHRAARPLHQRRNSAMQRSACTRHTVDEDPEVLHGSQIWESNLAGCAFECVA